MVKQHSVLICDMSLIAEASVCSCPGCWVMDDAMNRNASHLWILSSDELPINDNMLSPICTLQQGKHSLKHYHMLSFLADQLCTCTMPSTFTLMLITFMLLGDSQDRGAHCQNVA